MMENSTTIGVDEVGRGCLAGRVYAAAVILNEQHDWADFVDSKGLTSARRQTLCEKILRDHTVSIAFATVEEIFELNILHASLLAMNRAVLGLGVTKGLVLVDGNQAIPNLAGFQQKTIVQGDQKIRAIGAASIVAKVTRDRYMAELSQRYPQYGFEKHKGYGTKIHREAILKWGPTEEHRRAFAGVREFLQHSI